MRARTTGKAVAVVVAVVLGAGAVGQLVGPEAETSDREARATPDGSPPTQGSLPEPSTSPTRGATLPPPSSSPAPPPSSRPLPGGWSEVDLPLDLAAANEDLVPANGGDGVFAIGRDLVVTTRGGFTVHEGLLPRTPDVLSVGEVGGTRWVVATWGTTVTIFDGESARSATNVPPPLGSGALGVAARDDGFVIVARAEDPEEGSPTYLLDPSSGAFTELGHAPVAANRRENSSLVMIDGAALLVGTWLDRQNVPADDSLGAAVLPRGGQQWSMLPRGTLSSRWADAVALDNGALVVDGVGQTAWLTPSGWRAVDDTPLFEGACGLTLATSGRGVLLTSGCYRGVAYFDETESWTQVASPTLDARSFMTAPVGLRDGFLVPSAVRDALQTAVTVVLRLDPADAWPLVAGPLGHRLATPPGWRVAQDDLAPSLDSPTIAASTAPMPVGGDGCPHLPTAALEALGPEDALVSIQLSDEHQAPSDLPRLGAIPALREQWSGRSFVGCPVDGDDLRLYWIPVAWGSQQAHVLVAHHRDAPARIIEEALLVANSLSWH